MTDPRFVFPGEESDEVVIVRTGLIRQRLSTTTSDEEFSPPTTDLWGEYRKGVGITEGTGGVSEWADQSGNDRHLAQATEAQRPANSSGVIVFTAASNDFLQVVSALAQPVTLYARLKQTAWTNGKRLFDGGTDLDLLVSQNSASPEIALSVNGGSQVCRNTDLTVGEVKALVIVSNDDASRIRVGSAGTAVVGDVGSTTAAAGLTVGGRQTGADGSAIEVQDIWVYSGVHDEATETSMLEYIEALA